MKFFILIIIFPFQLFAQTNLLKNLEEYAQNEHKLKDFDGSILVVNKKKVILKKSFGMADREWSISNTADTKFRIGSITKQFTAASILQLAEQGKLSIDDKLNKYFENYPNGDLITIKMLLNHSSGVKNYTELPEFLPKSVLPMESDSVIAIFKDKGLDFKPGTQFHYSNSGYFLLGVIVEKASGLKLSEFLDRNIFNKVGLTNTSLDRSDSVLRYRAKGYGKSKKGIVENAPYMSMNLPFSAGAIISTTEDLYLWTQALFGNKIISASSRAKMITPYFAKYGFGLGIDSLNLHKRVSHGGGIPGFISFVSYYPEDDLFIAVLSNNSSKSDGLATALASIFFEMPIEKAYLPKEVAIDPLLLKNYEGIFDYGVKIKLINKNGKLYQIDDNYEIELKPESKNRFFYSDNSFRFIDFEIDGQGKVLRSWFIQDGRRTEMKKSSN